MKKNALALAAVAAAIVSAISIAVAKDARADVHARDARTASPTLTVRTTRFGKILFAGNGRVLYGFTRDRRNGPSRCYGDCAAAWPVYFAKGTLKAGAGVKQLLIGTPRRRDGRRQVTYNGWPLYFYVGERSPGVILCQNVDEFGGLWLVVRPSGKLVR